MTTTIKRNGAYTDTAWNEMPSTVVNKSGTVQAFVDLFSVKVNFDGACEKTGTKCPCSEDSTGVVGFCPVDEQSACWLGAHDERCTCFKNSFNHCPTLGSNKASVAARVGVDDGNPPVNWAHGFGDGGCKSKLCEDGSGVTYRAGWGCMINGDLGNEKIRSYTAQCTYPASTVPNDGLKKGETNDLKTLSAGDKNERQLLKNYCWRVDPNTSETVKQPFAITNPDCHVLRDDNAQYKEEVKQWCTGQIDKLVVMGSSAKVCDCRKSLSAYEKSYLDAIADIDAADKYYDNLKPNRLWNQEQINETKIIFHQYYQRILDNKFGSAATGWTKGDPRRCAECDGRKEDGTWEEGFGGCDCWNDLNDKDISNDVNAVVALQKESGADCAWMKCITPRATNAGINLYPDKETQKCPPPPKCSAVISIAKGSTVGNIAQNFKCDDTPGPPKPGPNKPDPNKPDPNKPSVWNKIKNFLKRIHPKVLIAPAVVLLIAIVVGIFEKRKAEHDGSTDGGGRIPNARSF